MRSSNQHLNQSLTKPSKLATLEIPATKAWNYKKSFTEEEVMNFTNLRFPSPSICEYHTFEEDSSPKKKWPEPKTIIGFKMDLSTFQKAKYQENYDPISKTGQTSSTLA
ncbi:hypothetical protein DY000_02038933 [Brassica cretica]|uniref:Uncharacterized protein n=1 Tax=Brassica cretica TaxID=69181 RepID=A0ABQ7B6L5_BRACR|nr:hypothetical protein DY000_02038933 [Brassica cretica]